MEKEFRQVNILRGFSDRLETNLNWNQFLEVADRSWSFCKYRLAKILQVTSLENTLRTYMNVRLLLHQKIWYARAGFNTSQHKFTTALHILGVRRN
jgi:hypothetical protein